MSQFVDRYFDELGKIFEDEVPSFMCLLTTAASATLFCILYIFLIDPCLKFSCYLFCIYCNWMSGSTLDIPAYHWDWLSFFSH